MASKPPTLAAIRAITDPTERTRAATTYIDERENEAREGRHIRDNAIRELKRGGVSIPQIAERTGVNIATVKAVVR